MKIVPTVYRITDGNCSLEVTIQTILKAKELLALVPTNTDLCRLAVIVHSLGGDYASGQLTVLLRALDKEKLEVEL